MSFEALQGMTFIILAECRISWSSATQRCLPACEPVVTLLLRGRQVRLLTENEKRELRLERKQQKEKKAGGLLRSKKQPPAEADAAAGSGTNAAVLQRRASMASLERRMSSLGRAPSKTSTSLVRHPAPVSQRTLSLRAGAEHCAQTLRPNRPWTTASRTRTRSRTRSCTTSRGTRTSCSCTSASCFLRASAPPPSSSPATLSRPSSAGPTPCWGAWRSWAGCKYRCWAQTPRSLQPSRARRPECLREVALPGRPAPTWRMARLRSVRASARTLAGPSFQRAAALTRARRRAQVRRLLRSDALVCVDRVLERGAVIASGASDGCVKVT